MAQAGRGGDVDKYSELLFYIYIYGYYTSKVVIFPYKSLVVKPFQITDHNIWPVETEQSLLNFS